jgi:putative transposase
MKNSRFTEEQIIQILKEGEGGSIADVLRRYNIAKGTYYAWRSKYSVELPEIKRLKKLEEENRKLKQLLAAGDRPLKAIFD